MLDPLSAWYLQVYLHNDYYVEDIPDAEINEDVSDAGMLDSDPPPEGLSRRTIFSCLALLNRSIQNT